MSKLKQRNLLDGSVQVTGYRKCHQCFSCLFTIQDGLCFCYNVTGLFEAAGITCNPSEFHLFIESSSRSLKAVLLHNRIKHCISSLGLAQKRIQQCFQNDFTNFPLYICLWDNTDTVVHYHRQDWPQWA